MSDRKNYRILSDDELDNLFDAAPAERWRVLFQTTVKHGLRNQEARKLQRHHLDLDEQVIYIERDNTKSRHGVRSVPIPDSFTSVLREHLDTYCEARTDYVFVSNRKTHISGRYFEKLIRRAAVEGGLYPPHITVEDVTREIPYAERIVPHSLRHTYATRLLRDGTPIEDVSDLLGHGSVQTTIEHYRHLDVEDFRASVNKTFG